MKRIIILVTSIILIVATLSFFSLAVSASPQPPIFNSTDKIVYLEDGGYLVISTSYNHKLLSNESEVEVQRDLIFEAYGSQDTRHYNGKNELTWIFTMYGTYTVTYGQSAVCTNATYKVEIFDNAWKFSNGSTSYSGNYAFGLGVFKDKPFLFVLQTIIVDTYLGCDVYGVMF